MRIHHSPHTHTIPIPMGIPIGIPIPTAALGYAYCETFKTVTLYMNAELMSAAVVFSHEECS